MPYNVYRSESLGSRNHVMLFVATNGPDAAGVVYHVVGSILQGMTFQTEARDQPERTDAYVPGSKELVGRVDEADMPRLEAVCRATPPPARQVTLGGRRLDPSKPLYRCGEWIEEVRARLLEEQIVKV